MTCLPKSLKSKHAARESFTAWDPGACLRALMGSRDKDPGGGLGAKPPKLQGLTAFSLQNTVEICSILTHSSYKFSPIGKKLHGLPAPLL